MANNTDGSYLHAPQACTLATEAKLKSGIPELDSFLNGGFSSNGIVEICGESGSGKTLLCLQLCLSVQLPIKLGGLDGTAVYICTESTFPIKRLQQLIQNMLKQHSRDYGNYIFIEHIFDLNNFKESLTKKLPLLIQKKKVKLIIVDSIAALFRGVYDKDASSNRTTDLRSCATILHNLNRKFCTNIICINQVTTNISEKSTTVAALGLAWGNMVNTRIQLIKQAGSIRLIKIIFSPYLPPKTICLSINESGISHADL